MFIQTASPEAARKALAFTLLEVVIAVLIMSMISISIYRVLQLNLSAIQIASEQGEKEAVVASLLSLVQAQLNDLPPGVPGAIQGQAFKFDEAPRDELRWLATAGGGLLTAHAEGPYYVTLTLRQLTDSKELEMGVRRVPTDNSRKEEWYPLLQGVDGFEVRYFDPRANSWLPRWNDRQARPALVRVRIWRTGQDDPYEAVLSLPARPSAA